MSLSKPATDYALGYTDAEHERLIRQAARLAPITERLFREAGIGPGQRVLDIGSGVGDVAMLAARIVGPTGEVMGVERDPHSIVRAKARVAEAGLHNVTFTQSDVAQIPDTKPFDAAIGRLILMFLPDPVGVLRSLTRLVRPGGVVVFQEVSFKPFLALSAPYPLWHEIISTIHTTFLRCKANPEMGLALYQAFQHAGLPAPTMRMEIPLGNDPEFIRLIYEVLRSLQPQLQQSGLSLEPLGDLDTLPARLQAEIDASNSVVSWMGLVGAWSKRPSASS